MSAIESSVRIRTSPTIDSDHVVSSASGTPKWMSRWCIPAGVTSFRSPLEVRAVIAQRELGLVELHVGRLEQHAAGTDLS